MEVSYEKCFIQHFCPNCHRRIHYAIKQDRKQMIETFYFNRIENIKTHGINITLDKLEHWYG